MTTLLPCPLCGAQDGYTLSDGSTYRWANVTCHGCGELVTEARSMYPRLKDQRTDTADAAWNAAGAYAQSLRDATALAVAAERERCILATKRPVGWWNSEQLRVAEEIRFSIKAGRHDAD